MESPETNPRASKLTPYKALPRRRVISSEPLQQKERVNPHQRRASDSTREDISSWIESASPTTSNPNQHLPLTPPPLPDDTLGKDQELVAPESLEDDRLADNATPLISQMSPLTPDLTPPRIRHRDEQLTTPPALRYPSSTSAAESFRTAREFATSVDSFRQFSSPESDLSTVIQNGTTADTLISTGNIPLSMLARNIGLGLGLGLKKEDESSTVVPAVPEYLHTTEEDVLEDPLVVEEPVAVQEIDNVKRNARSSVVEDATAADNAPQRTDSFSATKDGSLLLRNRIVSDRLASHRRSLHKPPEDTQHLRDSADLSNVLPNGAHNEVTSVFTTSSTREEPLLIRVDTETKIEIENLESPVDPSVSVVEQVTPPTSKKERKRDCEDDSGSPVNPDMRRLSRLSATSSNIVEAIVITPPRRRRHKLRKSSKNYCLRATSTSTVESNTNSSKSNNANHTLRHKSAALPDKTKRVSSNSDSGISMGFDTFDIKPNTIPTSQVPQRRSSLKAQRKNNPALSTHTEKKDSRPVTAPDRLMSPTGEIMSQMRPIFDTRSHSLRRHSESRGREVRHAAPIVIPPRSSSLSAPTSQSNSRTTSLTSEARKSQEQHRRKSSTRRRSSSPHVRISLPEPEPAKTTRTEGFIDPFGPETDSISTPQASPYLRSSLTRTPFSVISTPGPVEYGQGTTMNIYPHNNESVLMVQHTHRPESQDGAAALASREVMRAAYSGYQNAVPRQKLSDDEMGSQEMRRNISATSTSFSSPTKGTKSGKPFDIRRTPSWRRHSDSYITPLSRLDTVAKSTTPRRRINVNDPSNTLSSFWRPNGFWNDLSDSDDDLDPSEPEIASPDSNLVVRNTLGLPQQRVVQGPVGLTRRLASFRRRKQMNDAEKANSNSTISSRALSSGRDSKALPDKHRRAFSLGSISHIYDNIHQKRVEKAEAQKEERRQRLKKTIGPAKLRESARHF